LMFIGVSFLGIRDLQKVSAQKSWQDFGLEVFHPSSGARSKVKSAEKATSLLRLRKILYLGCCAGAVLACVVCLAALSAAQRGDRGNHEDRPQITPQDKVLNKKKITGEPRAVGLLQLTDKGKATLVPIAILINGKFYDASSYKASPVPMALDSGTVYEGERTGSSLGLFTVSSALQSKDPNSATPWIGAGNWLPQGADAKKTALKAEDVPVGLVPSDEPPRLTKSSKPAKDASADSTATPAGSQTSSSPSSSQDAKPADASQAPADKKTPDQTKPTQSTANQSPENPSASQTSTQTTSTQPKSDSSKSNPSAPTKSDEAAPAAGEDTNSQADTNRPKLRRGKPTEPLPSDDSVPGYGKAGDSRPGSPAVAADVKSASAPAKPDATPAKADAAAVKTPPQLIPAISDAGGPDPRSFVYEWAQTEKDERRKDVLALAQQQLHAYLQERAKNSIAANAAPAKPVPAKATSSARKPAAKMPDLVLEDLQIRTFDLWTNNQPVIVLTATAHPPLPAVGSATSAATVPEYSITLVARTDIYNNQHKLYVGITDKFHLDVTPRLELIDAVDADGDGRGELLFHETSDAGSGYIIYRATGDTLWKMFDSLSPQ
jgi:hypothetical protein